MAGTSSTPLTSQRKLGKATREAFGQALAKLGEQYTDIVVVDGDVHNSTHTGYFAKKFPDRFFEAGIAESDLVGIASGLAASGKRAWASSFACFRFTAARGRSGSARAPGKSSRSRCTTSPTVAGSESDTVASAHPISSA